MIKIISTINSFLLLLTIVSIVNNQIQIVQGKPYVFAIPLITVDQIKNFFTSLSNGLQESTSVPPSIKRLVDSCHKSFTNEENNNNLTTINADEFSMDLSSPYFFYSSDNQTAVFTHVFSNIEQTNAPCPVEGSICDLLPSIVSKDAPMNWVIANLLNTYWESCMSLIGSSLKSNETQ